MSNVSRLTKEFINKMDSQREIVTEYYKFGAEYLGPFLAGYTRWLEQALKAGNYNKIFFFSRDGYLLEKAFEIVNDSYETEYVYFSRNSVRHALLHFCKSYEEIISLLPWERYITTGYFLDALGLLAEEQLKIAQERQLLLDEVHAFNNLLENDQLKEIYDSTKEKTDEYSLEQDRLMEKYLEQINFCGNCAIVDIGWHGSMQYYLEKYCQYKNIPVEVHGFYMGIDLKWPVLGEVNGYLYSPENLKMRKSILCFFGGYEKLMQKREGSAFGYRQEVGKISPVVSAYEYEEDMLFQELIKDVQTGSLDFVRYVYQENIMTKKERIWTRRLIRLGKYPTNKELRMFENFYNIDGRKVYYISQKPIYKYSLQELKHAVSDSVWKTGFLKSLFRVPFPYYWIYFWLRK